MIRILSRNAGLLFVAVFLLVGTLHAQSAGLSGTVLDPSGASISGAQITITNEATAASRNTVSESDGKFVFTQLVPGKYQLEVSAPGFRKAVREHLELLIGTTSTIDLKLEVGAVAETTIVEARLAPLNTTDASIGTPISGSELNALPVLDMNPAGLLGLQAGVPYIPSKPDNPSGYGGATELDGRSGAVNGARSDQTNVTLDGVDVNDAQKGYAFTSVLRVPQESLAEFRTTTTSYDADSGGRSSAAQVQLVTKSGSNDVHGSLYYSHRNEAFNANDFFLNRSDIPEPKFRHHLYGGSLGGPVLKDRIFLFGNFERLTENLFKSAERVVPSAAFKDGVFFYQCDATVAQPVPCGGLAGNFVTGISGEQYGMNANNQPCRASAAGCGPLPGPGADGLAYYALTPNQITAIDPLGIGPNSGILQYLSQYPDPNSSGSDDGLNFLGYRFAAPVNNFFNTAVVRADVHLDRAGNHTIFWRGSLMHDTINVEPQFPGQAPRQTLLNNNKGFSVGYAAVLTNNLVNNFRYGYTRISDKASGVRNQEFVDIRFIDSLDGSETAGTYNDTKGRILPQHHFRDDLSWIKGTHTLSFGGEIRTTRNSTFNNANSFHTFVVNPSWLPDGARVIEPGQASCNRPGCSAVPKNASGTSFRDRLTQMLGPISTVDAFYNFDKTGAAQDEGAPVSRRFAVNEYELYVQDKWRVTPSFTLTAGLRYYIGSPPWETNGNQVVPTPSFADWFDCRQGAMLAGQPTSSCGLIQTDLGGPANGRAGYYDYDYRNFSPRIAIAWAPRFKDGLLHSIFGDAKTSVRAGYSIVYDRIGNGLATTFDQLGSFGLSTDITSGLGDCGLGNEGQSFGPCTRFTGLNDTAAAKAQSLAPAPAAGFPSTPPEETTAVTAGLDNKIKTPYAHTFDLAVARELPGGLTFEAAYVGRLAHRLTLIRDFAMPADLKDPASGVSGFQAARNFEAFAQQNAGLSDHGLTGMAAVPYWENFFPGFGPTGINSGCLQFNVFGLTTNADGTPVVPGSCGTDDGLPLGYSPTQVAYDYVIGYHGTPAGGSGFGTSTVWQDVDFGGFPAYATCPSGTDLDGDGFLDCPHMFFPSQYVNLHTWTTKGYSYYHALQLMLRKQFSHGVSFGLNYTFSHSLDTSSTPERQEIIGGAFTGGYTGTTINAWDIRQEYGSSDFDIRHQFNGYYVAELPFGRGKRLGKNAARPLDFLIGGWQLSGIVHLNSGVPANIINGRTWPTNWDLQGNATCAPVGAYSFGLDVGPCPSTQNVHGAIHGGSGQPTPNLFADPDQALQHFRFTETGARGQRNVIYGDKYFSMDLGIQKRFNLTERINLTFRWDIFNLTNSTYFDTTSLSASIEDAGTFGDYTQILGQPRQMQLSAKFTF